MGSDWDGNKSDVLIHDLYNMPLVKNVTSIGR